MRFLSFRRAVALAAVAAGLLAVPTAQAASTYTPVRGTDFFAPSGVWNQPLAGNARLANNSRALVATLNANFPAYVPYINTASYSTPIYTVPAAQPTVHITADHADPKLVADFNQVPLPDDARPAQGTDGNLVLWQPSTQTMWEFWRLYKDASGSWHAVWGGKMTNVSSNPGYYQGGYGATASSLPDVGGLMTLQEETDGVINHALAVAIPNPKAGTWVYPAQRTDGTSTAPNAIPEGTRFRLPASLNIDALGLPRQTAMMAKAVQRYGMVVTDKAGAVTFKAEDPYLYTQKFAFDPYAYLFGGVSSTTFLSVFPWQYLQVVKS